MSLIVFGLNHKSAPIAIREKLAHLNEMTIPEVDGYTLEVVPLCTCNRVELYYSGPEKDARASFIELLARKNLKYDNFKEYFYEFKEKDCVKHLFNVASGLDSMILGENQILHQIKNSYKEAVSKNLVNKQLHSLFQKTLEVGKKVRSQTEISGNHVSIASTAVDLAKNLFGPLNSSKALILGAGEMASLVAVHLHENGVEKMFFINRTESKAADLAKKFGGIALSYDYLADLLADCDIVISSTSSADIIISKSMMEKAINKRKERAIFAIDIAVPRDIEPECRELENVFLYDVDDLKNVVNDSFSHRRTEAKKAESIIYNEVNEFMDFMRELLVVPHIKKLKERAKQQCSNELEKFFTQYPELTPELKEACEEYSRQMAAKWLHEQITNLKEQGSSRPFNLDNLSLNLDLNPVKVSKYLKHSPMYFASKQHRGTGTA